MREFFSNGKLLISGEYVVLDGAVSLAIPTKYGQLLTIENIGESKIIWKSLDEKGKVWFETNFNLNGTELLSCNDDEVSTRLIQILNAAKQLNPQFLKESLGYKITTNLDFPRNWGLGTSSTLINNIANWAEVDAYKLLEKTFGGSGYDIACAQNDCAISYQLTDNVKLVNKVKFNPKFKNSLYFVHLNKKQNSRDGIKHYRDRKGDLKTPIENINNITQDMITCDNLKDFQVLIEKHEVIIAEITKQTSVKQNLFSDFKGAIKSLGAWGGDFVLVASETNPELYFNNKGYKTVIKYQDMILNF